MNLDEGSYQLSHTYIHFLDPTADRRIKTRKNWVPASTDEDFVMRLKRQNKVLKFYLWYKMPWWLQWCAFALWFSIHQGRQYLLLIIIKLLLLLLLLCLYSFVVYIYAIGRPIRVRALRKFASSSSVASSPCGSVAASSPSDWSATDQSRLPAVYRLASGRPVNTDDFLTFLCLRGLSLRLC